MQVSRRAAATGENTNILPCNIYCTTCTVVVVVACDGGDYDETKTHNSSSIVYGCCTFTTATAGKQYIHVIGVLFVSQVTTTYILSIRQYDK